MSDRDKMVDVIKEWSDGAFSPIYAGTLADRLIKAGFREIPSEEKLRKVIYDETPSILDKAQLVHDMMWFQK